MTKLLSTLLPLLAALSHSASARAISRADVAAVKDLRVLPLGASITFGQKSTDGNGYRKDIRDKLVAEGYNVNMIGSQKAGTMCDNDNEGWPGFTIQQVQDKAALSIGDAPNLILLNAGTNDCVQNIDIDNAQNRLGNLIDYLFTSAPDTTIIASTLLVNKTPSKETCIQKVNPKFQSMVADKQKQGKHVLIVDMHAADGPQLADLVDDTHPDDAGYAKMATIWDRGIADAAARGWIKPAPVKQNIPANGC